MRPIVRQSARLASHTKSAKPSPRRPCYEQGRAFNTTLPRAQEPRSPSGSSDPHTPFNERREQSKKAENGNSWQEKAAEEEYADPQAVNDGRKHATRRTLRQKRANDVPKPPPIPEWFLQHNVRLYKDSPGLPVDKTAGLVIRCVDAETGHTLFTVPYYKDEKATPEQTDRVEKSEKEVSSPAEQATAPNVSKPGAVAEPSSTEPETTIPSDQTKSSFDQTFFDHKYQTSRRLGSKRPASKAAGSAAPFNPPEFSLSSNLDPMKWVFLEAETSIRGALSVANEDQRSASFAADRVDLSLQCPDPKSHDRMDEFVRDLARTVQADLIRLDANDFAELAEDYVGHGRDEPGSFSTLGYDAFDGYEASALGHQRARSQTDEDEENEMDEDEEVDDNESDAFRGNPFARLDDFRRVLQDSRDQLGNAIRGRVIGIGIGIPPSGPSASMPRPSYRPRTSSSNSDMSRDDARLTALLEHLLDAPKQKATLKESSETEGKAHRRREQRKTTSPDDNQKNADRSYQDSRRILRSHPAFWIPATAKSLVGYLGEAVKQTQLAEPPISLESGPKGIVDESSRRQDQPRTIVHIRDLRDICNSRLGENIIHRLVKVVRKRRRSGEQIVIVGSTAQDVPGPYHIPGDTMDVFPFRTMSVPPFFNTTVAEDTDYSRNSTDAPQKSLDDPAYGRILEINLRHVRSMLRRLRPEDNIDLLAPDVRGQLNMPGMHFLTQKVLSLDSVQRLAVVAIGLSQSHAVADSVSPIHVALAGLITTRSDHAAASWTALKERREINKLKAGFGDLNMKSPTESQSAEARVERLKKICNSHETRLLTGMVDPQNIKTHFSDVHAPAETIEALKSLTTLSLLRPEAFKYGVLANDRLPGLLLYGPPGTGKTLLAKAVAKESKATVLEVSGAQIYEKYVGEGEKMVRAVFTLAKKLSPCVVFIDEADAIFGNRSNAGNRTTHREIINQFLREWDGMDDHSVFMMVASNRPFDLDDAVLRRLPRRLLVDLPVAKDRESILGIHLKDEDLDPSVSLAALAEQTPLYSGSDLKNLSVAAALACVREENELVETHREDKDFRLPEKRTLTARHFEKALAEISASISEDMSSLTAIRKFDEQYGDRKGRRKKMGYGFGAVDAAVDEGAARVRPPPPPPASTPPPP